MPSSEGVMRVGLLLISSLIAALVMGCGSAPIRTEGIAGPVTWQARDPRGSGILRETHDGVIVTKSNDREAVV
jgi:hypothetical protein